MYLPTNAMQNTGASSSRGAYICYTNTSDRKSGNAYSYEDAVEGLLPSFDNAFASVNAAGMSICPSRKDHRIEFVSTDMYPTPQQQEDNSNGYSVYSGYDNYNSDYSNYSGYRDYSDPTAPLHKNRYDVTILINGLPLIQIELKRPGVELNEAVNQINRYRNHSFRELFRYNKKGEAKWQSTPQRNI